MQRLPNLIWLRSFAAAAQHLSFTQAAAWAWGVILFLFWIVAGSVDAFTSPHAGLEQILLVPLAAILSAFNGAWSVPVWIWTWAKFDHPWWAFFIALFLSVIFGRRR